MTTDFCRTFSAAHYPDSTTSPRTQKGSCTAPVFDSCRATSLGQTVQLIKATCVVPLHVLAGHVDPTTVMAVVRIPRSFTQEGQRSWLSISRLLFRLLIHRGGRHCLPPSGRPPLPECPQSLSRSAPASAGTSPRCAGSLSPTSGGPRQSVPG